MGPLTVVTSTRRIEPVWCLFSAAISTDDPDDSNSKPGDSKHNEITQYDHSGFRRDNSGRCRRHVSLATVVSCRLKDDLRCANRDLGD